MMRKLLIHFLGGVTRKQHFNMRLAMEECRYVLRECSGHVDSEDLQKAIEQALHDTNILDRDNRYGT